MGLTPQVGEVAAGTGIKFVLVPTDVADIKLPASLLVEAKDGAPAPLSHAGGETYAATQHGLILLARRVDAAAAPPGVAADQLGPPSMDAAGRLWVRVDPEVIVHGRSAHDQAIGATNPNVVGGVASVAEPTPVDADGDAVRGWYDRYGRAVVVTDRPPATPSAGTQGPVSATVTAAGTTEIIAAPAAGLSIHVTGAWLSNAGSTKIRASLRAGATGTDRLKGTLAGDGGGAVLAQRWKLPSATGLFANLAAAGDVDVNVGFYVAA